MRFTNKTVFITGAAGGIGRQTGLSFAKEGANVAVSDLDFDMASRVAKEIKSVVWLTVFIIFLNGLSSENSQLQANSAILFA